VVGAYDVVEIVPDDQDPPTGEEVLPGRVDVGACRVRFGGAAGRRVRVAAVAALVLGGVLAGDGAAMPRLPSLSTPYLYRGLSHCPAGVHCQRDAHARRDLLDSYRHLFTGMSMISGEVWYEQTSGVVFFQELDAAADADPTSTISLREQRLDHGGSLAFGPTIDLVPHRDPPASPRRGTVSMTHRWILVLARRGGWLITAIISGPVTHSLPVEVALRWVATAPVPA
jgi:hypothetical protein